MKRAFFGVVGFLACPCHIPLYLALLGGTAFGGIVAAYEGWLVVGMSTLCVAAILAFGGGSLIPSRNRACAIPDDAHAMRSAAAIAEPGRDTRLRRQMEVTHEPAAGRKS